ncbi:MAG: F0F1 ATP synthase subunit delta [Clostridiales bacterium]|jgi:F0F1-type ATP synthase delta subunit|nr:F0F1 ATP synthase subunit delta [Clostridiales bacterium]
MMEKAQLFVPIGTSRENVSFICRSFEEKLGKKLDFTVSESDGILGGFIANIDKRTYDNSVSAKLSQMKKHLLKK